MPAFCSGHWIHSKTPAT